MRELLRADHLLKSSDLVDLHGEEVCADAHDGVEEHGEGGDGGVVVDGVVVAELSER